jgi:hypothetical protein
MDLWKEFRKIGFYDRIEFCRFIHEFYSNLNNSSIRDDDVNIININYYGGDGNSRGVIGTILLDNSSVFYLDINMEFCWAYKHEDK